LGRCGLISSSLLATPWDCPTGCKLLDTQALLVGNDRGATMQGSSCFVMVSVDVFIQFSFLSLRGMIRHAFFSACSIFTFSPPFALVESSYGSR